VREVNTTRLIGHWSMDGARSDQLHGFGSAVDILALVGGRATEAAAPADESLGAGRVLVKPAGEDDWQPLFAAT
jgi:hypothetical protein